MSSSFHRALVALMAFTALGASALAFAAAGEKESPGAAMDGDARAPAAPRAPEVSPPTAADQKRAPSESRRDHPTPAGEGQTAVNAAATAAGEKVSEQGKAAAPRTGASVPEPVTASSAQPPEPGSSHAPSAEPAASARQKCKAAREFVKAGGSDLFCGFDPLDHRLEEDHLVCDLESKRTAVLSLVPGLQGHVAGIFKRNTVPFGAVVAMEPATGRVLAYVSHSSAEPGAGDLARDPAPPSASVFKVITAAALLDSGIEPDRRVCYGGGMRKLVEADLNDNPARDSHCVTMEDALGYSVNAVFAKLADRHLDAQTLERYASAFGFGHSLPFDARTRPSPMEVPKDRVEFARTAAGFWHMYMSPLHGALIAATVANRGVMPRASMIDRVVDSAGCSVAVRQPSAFRSVIPSSTAKVLARMMTRTVSRGTARRAFHDPQGRAFLPGLEVAGKTGSLTQQRPFRDYSWWIGFAPAENPTIAVAALVVNSPLWRIKASYVARETLRYYLR